MILSYIHCHFFVSLIMLSRFLASLFQTSRIHHLPYYHSSSFFFLYWNSVYVLSLSLSVCIFFSRPSTISSVLYFGWPLAMCSHRRRFFVLHDSHVWSTLWHTVRCVGGHAWKTERQTQVGQILLANISSNWFYYYLSWAYAGDISWWPAATLSPNENAVLSSCCQISHCISPPSLPFPGGYSLTAGIFIRGM